MHDWAYDGNLTRFVSQCEVSVWASHYLNWMGLCEFEFSVSECRTSKDHKIQDSQEQELLRGNVGDGIEMIYDKRNVTIIICEN